MRMTKRRKRSRLMAVANFVAAIGVALGVCWMGLSQLIDQRRRKRVELAAVGPEPTTVDELINTVSTAGPVTVVEGSINVWN
jgi:hypothetical protein